MRKAKLLRTMTASGTNSRRIPVPLHGWALPILIVALGGCGRSGEETGRPSGKAAETVAYWERFSRAAGFGLGIEALDFPAYSGPIPSKHWYAVLGDIADAEQMRGRTVLTLPTKDVDPKLVGYTDAYGKARKDLAGTVSKFVELGKEVEDLAGKPLLDAARLKQLLQVPPGVPGGVLVRTLTENSNAASRQLASLQEAARQLDAEAGTVLKELERLRTEETGLRTELAKRWAREFPVRAVSQPAASRTDARLAESQIIVTMMGQCVGGLVNGWTFEDPREFKSLSLLTATNHSDVLAEYEIQAHVQGLRTGAERDFHLQLTYGRLYTRWVLLELREAR